MGNTGRFEVWVSSEVGMEIGPRFNTLSTALRYVGAHLEEASFAIRLPNGMWFENGEGGVIFSRTAGEPPATMPLAAAARTPARLEPFGITKGGFWLAGAKLPRKRARRYMR